VVRSLDIEGEIEALETVGALCSGAMNWAFANMGERSTTPTTSDADLEKPCM